jgi:cell division transport system permease protein
VTGPPRRARSTLDWQRLLAVWLGEHARACLFSAGQIFRQPAGSLLTVAVIGIALALPTLFYLVLLNVQQVSAGWGGSARIALYLRMDVEESAGRELAGRLASHPAIKDVRYISRAEALEEYRQMSGFAEALEMLPDNPLPAVILVQPRLEGFSGENADALARELRALPEVESGQFDRQWVQRLFAMMAILQRAVLILAALLALAVLLIVGNTIRLAIMNRRTEIEINKLFGATDAFVRRPFLYNGIIHGVLGAVFAWLLVSGATLLLAGPVARLSDLYLGSFSLSGLSARETLGLLAAGGLLGLAGSWLAVSRHLKDMGPF